MFAMFRCFGGKSSHQKADNEDKYKMSWRHQKVAPAKPASKISDSKKKPGTGECDACDGDHPTSKCPHYKKKRGKHPDCKKYTGKRDIGKGTGGFVVGISCYDSFPCYAGHADVRIMHTSQQHQTSHRNAPCPFFLFF